jgi:histone deacetylase complex regulatory component SIN3
MSQNERDNFKYDRRKFTTLREKWIKNTYGEMGEQMLKLLQKNPSKAIPIIYDRFKTNY